MASVRKLWAPRPLEVYHARTRTRGVNSPVYWLTRLFAQPALMLYFRLARNGHRHVPGGAVILASNHRSFLDPFVLGCCVRRPIYFVAKEQLFKNPLAGWFLNCLGAFPLRRGASDEESVKTSLRLLERGEVVVIFPEGTRVTRGSLRPPRRGVGRMALESGAPVVPVAVSGSERARRGWRIRPVKVHLRFGAPLTFPRVRRPSPSLAGEVTERIWPCVALQWEWLGGLPPLRTAVVVGAGPVGTAAATVLAAAGLEVTLTCRTREQAERIASGPRQPGAELDRRIGITTLRDVELAGVDLVVLAVPCSALPAAVGEIGAHMGERSAVLVASTGLVPPLGTTPSAFVAERVRARAVASLAGPADPRGAIDEGAAVVLATRDVELRRQLGEVLQAGGVSVETTDDVTGTELAACARNAAALASEAVSPADPDLAGAAAGRIFAEVHALAVASGGRSETFAGLAGESVPERTAEFLATVPLLGLAFEREGIEAPVTTGLRRVLEGEASPDQWLESMRLTPGGKGRRAA
jgi:glycerol-3-phosphate dehydrogenase (NAD(P)+)